MGQADVVIEAINFWSHWNFFGTDDVHAQAARWINKLNGDHVVSFNTDVHVEGGIVAHWYSDYKLDWGFGYEPFPPLQLDETNLPTTWGPTVWVAPFLRVALHEWGHIMGLLGGAYDDNHNPQMYRLDDRRRVMWYDPDPGLYGCTLSTQPSGWICPAYIPFRSLGEWDINKVRGHYGLPPSNTDGLVVDPTDDAGDLPSPPYSDVPDLRSVLVEADRSTGLVEVRIDFEEDTFTEEIQVQTYLDIDENRSTGWGDMGTDFTVSVFSTLWGLRTEVVHFPTGSISEQEYVGSVGLLRGPDYLKYYIPLAMLDDDDGHMRFRVHSFKDIVWPNGNTSFGGGRDAVPDSGWLEPGRSAVVP